MTDECQQKYGSAAVWKACCSVFDFLNIAAVCLCYLSDYNGCSQNHRLSTVKVFVCTAAYHPTFGHSIKYEFLPELKRFLTRVHFVVGWRLVSSRTSLTLLDLMWSDPDEVDNWAVSPRGAGWLFGKLVTQEVYLLFIPFYGFDPDAVHLV